MRHLSYVRTSARMKAAHTVRADSGREVHRSKKEPRIYVEPVYAVV